MHTKIMSKKQTHMQIIHAYANRCEILLAERLYMSVPTATSPLIVFAKIAFESCAACTDPKDAFIRGERFDAEVHPELTEFLII